MQAQSNYEWSSGLSTGESINYQNGSTTKEADQATVEESNDKKRATVHGGAGDSKKPPTNSKGKNKSAVMKNRHSCDFLSKTMTPVLHRRQNVDDNRSNNACAKSTPHGPIPRGQGSVKQQTVSSSWSESYETAEKNANEEEFDDDQDYTLMEEQQFTDEEDEEEQDLGITINDNLNILTIDHGSPPATQRTTMFDVEETYEDVSRRPDRLAHRISTPFHGERPLTAETAGSDEDSRPATGEMRTPTDEQMENSNHHVESYDNDIDGRDIVTRGSSVSWSLSMNDVSPRKSTNKSKPHQNHAKPPIGVSSPRVCRKSEKGSRPEDMSTNYKSNQYSSQRQSRDSHVSAANENRNSHNNNSIPTPDLYSPCPSTPSVRSVAVGLGNSSLETEEQSEEVSRRRNTIGPAVTRGTSPTLNLPLVSQRSISMDSLATSRTARGENSTSVRGRIIAADEVDHVHQTNRVKVKQNCGAVFGSYESIQRAVSADDPRGRYPGLIPHAPTKPKRPYTAAAADVAQRRSKSLCNTYPPNRSPSAQDSQGKPPSGAGHFDVGRLRQRNRSALTSGKTTPRRTQERSPSPLRVRAIPRPTSQSMDIVRSKDYSLNTDKIRTSLDGTGVHVNTAKTSVERHRRYATRTVQSILANVSARLD